MEKLKAYLFKIQQRGEKHSKDLPPYWEDWPSYSRTPLTSLRPAHQPRPRTMQMTKKFLYYECDGPACQPYSPLYERCVAGEPLTPCCQHAGESPCNRKAKYPGMGGRDGSITR
jgi:hypothetical protein